MGTSQLLADRRGRPWNEVLRAWRLGRNWTQENFCEHYFFHAGHLGETRGDGRTAQLDETTLRRWEAGKSRAIHHRSRRVLEAMGAPLPPIETPGSARVSPPDCPPDELCTPPDEADHGLRLPTADAATLVHEVTRRDLSLNRRELGSLFSNVFTGSSLLERLERLLGAPVARAGFRAGRMRLGEEEIGELETAARLFRNWDDQFGGGLRRKAVIGQLNEVSDLLTESQSEDVSGRLHVVMAELAETAAMMSWDSGHQAVAQRYYLLALQAARAGDDLPFVGHVLAGMARQLLYLDRPTDALELVRLALDTSGDRTTSKVRSMLRTREAWAYSQLGRLNAFQRATSQAEDELSASTAGENHPHWIDYFDFAELHGTTGGRLLDLANREVGAPQHDDDALRGHATEASARISQALDLRRPNRLRASALDELGLAETFLLLGEFDQAAEIGHRAATVALQTSSDRVRVQLVDLHERTQRYAEVPVIAELRDRLRPLGEPAAASA